MKNIIGLLSILFLLTACTKDFESINTNENAPSEVQPELLFRQVLYGYGEAMSYEGFVAGNLLSQHFSMIDFNLFDRHALNSPQEGGNPWPIIYTALRDNETVLALSRENPAQAVYEGPALIMKSYLAMTLTDMFGDVPYFEAFQGRSAGVTTP
ncbi:MAG: SusD/RagB family nutrient-binding outer membrane lipoprotein, partial [Bacteroidota bacterium]